MSGGGKGGGGDINVDKLIRQQAEANRISQLTPSGSMLYGTTNAQGQFTPQKGAASLQQESPYQAAMRGGLEQSSRPSGPPGSEATRRWRGTLPMRHAGNGAAGANGFQAGPFVNGHDSEATIRLRLVEAVDTLRRLTYPRDGAPRALRGFWPEIHDRWRYVGQTRVLRVLPTAVKIDRLDEIIPLLLAVPMPWRQAAWLRATPLGWRSVGRTLACSHKCARRWERHAIEAIARARR